MTTNGTRAPFWRTLGRALRSPIERMALSESEARYQRAAVDAATTMAEQVVRRVEPDNDDFTQLLSGRGLLTRDLDEATAADLRQAAFEASLRNPHAIGYLRSLQRFVVGQGPTVTFEIEDEALAGRVSEWWKLFKGLNKWDCLEDEIPVRLWRDGEIFLRRSLQRAEGPVGGDLNETTRTWLTRHGMSEDMLDRPMAPAGMVFCRFIPPEHIRDPDGKISHGILTAGDDVQTVLGYVVSVDGQGVTELVPASEVLHEKIRVDSDVKRGRSILEPILRRSKQYEDWLTYRIMLNYVRSAVALIKKVTGTPTQVANIRAAQAKDRETTLNDRKAKMLKPGTTITATGGIEYDYLSPNIQAQDAQHDGRAIQLNMAAATGLPEYMFTGDASNANFASTMVAESPAVREFEDWQDTFRPVFEQVARWVLEAAAQYEAVEGLTPEVAAEIKIAVTFPPMLARDELKHTQANQIRQSGGILSREGWAEDEGIDYDIEKERIAAERAEDFDFTAPPEPNIGAPGK